MRRVQATRLPTDLEIDIKLVKRRCLRTSCCSPRGYTLAAFFFDFTRTASYIPKHLGNYIVILVIKYHYFGLMVSEALLWISWLEACRVGTVLPHIFS